VIESVGPQPWQRVKDPQSLPTASKPALLAGHLRDLDDEALGRLIRDHLVPLAADDQDANQAKRTGKFFDRCEGALDRILNRADEPLAWAGAAAASFNPAARIVIDKLISAIDQHRRDCDNENLWAALDHIKTEYLGTSAPRLRRSQYRE